MRKRLWSVVSAVALVCTAAGAETVGTFTLDGLSYVSFQDQEVVPLGSGSTIRFHFGSPQAGGAIPFTISPADVTIAPIDLSANQTLTYTLAVPTSGTMQTSETGRTLAFTAKVNATLAGGAGAASYTVPFTTETVSATDAEGEDEVEVTGLRLVDGAWYGQIVGATSNGTKAYPAPGTAVYMVLSGQFDQLP